MMIFTFFWFIFAVSASSESIKITNNSFETSVGNEFPGWVKYSWENQGLFSSDKLVYHSLHHSALIQNLKATDTRLMQRIEVEKNSKYKFTCWVRTEAVPANQLGANIGVETLAVNSPDVKGSTEWTQLTLYGETSDSQDFVTVTLGLGGYGQANTGKAWFDDFITEKIDDFPDGAPVVKLYSQDTQSHSLDLSKALLPITIIIFCLFSIILLILLFLNRNDKKIET